MDSRQLRASRSIPPNIQKEAHHNIRTRLRRRKSKTILYQRILNNFRRKSRAKTGYTFNYLDVFLPRIVGVAQCLAKSYQKRLPSEARSQFVITNSLVTLALPCRWLDAL